MKKGVWIAGGLIVVAVIVVVLLLLPSGEQENTATVIKVVDQVDAHSRSKDDWQPAVVDMIIYGGGQVRTGAASSAHLRLLEGIVRLAADTVFTVKESVTHQNKLLTTLFLQKGRLWANVTTDQTHEFIVETGSSVTAVRDTRFSIWVADEETLVSVVQGRVELIAQRQSVTVSAGQQAAVEPDQPPSLPEPMSDEERALWATEGGMPELAPPTPTPTPTHIPTPTPFPESAFSVQVVGYDEHGAMLKLFYDGDWSDLDGLAMHMHTSQNDQPQETQAVQVMEGRYLAEMTDVMYRFGEFDVELVLQDESNPAWSNTIEMRAEFEQWYPFIRPIFAASDFTDRSLDIVETFKEEMGPEYEWYAKRFCSPCDYNVQDPAGIGTPVYMPFSFQVSSIREVSMHDDYPNNFALWVFHPYTGFIFRFAHVMPGPLIEDFLRQQGRDMPSLGNAYDDPYPHETDIIPYDPDAIMCTWAAPDHPGAPPLLRLEGQISYLPLGLRHPDISPNTGFIDGGGPDEAWGNPRYGNCAALGLGDYGPCFTPDGQIAVANISMEQFLLNGWVDPGK